MTCNFSSGNVGDHLDQDARNAGSSDSSSTQTGADFEEHVVRFELEQVRHHRNINGCEIVLSKPIGIGLFR